MRKLDFIVMVIHAFKIINRIPFSLKFLDSGLLLLTIKKMLFSFFKHFSFIPEQEDFKWATQDYNYTVSNSF